jgi:FkbM family methyltransferase
MGNRFYKYAQFYGKKRDINFKMNEEKEMFLLPEFIKQGDTVLDLGANFAYYTERMSKLVGSKGKVYAFEPIPFTFDVFKMLVKSFKLKNVVYYKKGVSNKNETVQFRVPKMSFGTLSTGQAHISERKNNIKNNNDYKFTQEEVFDCDVVVLDDFFNPHLSSLSFIKIDIEGAELFALQGAENLIRQFKPVVLIEINPVFLEGFGLSAESILQFIKDIDHEIFYLEKNANKLLPLLGKPLWEDNFILIHQSKIDLYKNIIANV